MSNDSLNNSRMPSTRIKTRPTFVLVEPVDLKSVVDVPSLACAILLGACSSEDIDPVLIPGQTKIHDYLFSKGLPEVWSLMEKLDEEAIKALDTPIAISAILERGYSAFEVEMTELYQDIILDKPTQVYVGGDRLERFFSAAETIGGVYHYYLTHRETESLALVDLYVDEILEAEPCLIGFSIFTSFDPFTRAIRKKIKSRSDTPIIVGGAHMPYLPQQHFARLAKREHIDYLCVGMAEQFLPSLIISISKGEYDHGIPGIFRVKGEEVSGLPLINIQMSDTLNYPDYSQFDLDRYPTLTRILPVMTAYGCTWSKCAFCSHHKGYLKSFHAIPIEHVVDTLSHLQRRYRCNHFAIHDQEVPPVRARQLSVELLERKIENVRLYAYGILGKGYDKEGLFSLMKKAGFAALVWGLESGCQKVLDLMVKNTEIGQIERILHKSHLAGIRNLCFVMFGFPGENREDADETVEFLEENQEVIDLVIAGVFELVEQSPIAKNPEKWGMRLGKEGVWEKGTGMSDEESKAYHQRFMAKRSLTFRDESGTKLNHLPPSHMLRMLHFLMGSRGIMESSRAAELIGKNQLDYIYPVVLGEIEEGVLKTADTMRTFAVNKIKPVKPRRLRQTEMETFKLADGKRSARMILELVSKQAEGDRAGQEKVRELSLAFMKAMFEGRHALGFGEPFP